MNRTLILLLIAVLFAGCATTEDSEGESRATSPTGALLRGEITTDQYLEAITEANKEAREAEQFEVNKEPTRAFNTRTQRIEYVPKGTIQKWNEATQRWEFTPID